MHGAIPVISFSFLLLSLRTCFQRAPGDLPQLDPEGCPQPYKPLNPRNPKPLEPYTLKRKSLKKPKNPKKKPTAPNAPNKAPKAEDHQLRAALADALAAGQPVVFAVAPGFMGGT